MQPWRGCLVTWEEVRRTNQKPRKEYKVRRSTRTVAHDGLKQDVPEEEASDDNSICSLFRSDDEEDNIE